MAWRKRNVYPTSIQCNGCNGLELESDRGPTAQAVNLRVRYEHDLADWCVRARERARSFARLSLNNLLDCFNRVLLLFWKFKKV